jgi:hypothetical protein
MDGRPTGLNVDEVAQILGVKPRQARRLIVEGIVGLDGIPVRLAGQLVPGRSGLTWRWTRPT